MSDQTSQTKPELQDDQPAQSEPEHQEEIVSMVDVLEEEKRYEEYANAVLGGSDPRNCTYDKGYVPRQALYACTTCINPEMEPAGLCLACSLECHDGHDLIELYTKRNFRCDCGNSKFGDVKCELVPNRDDKNENNTYNQNFRGTYCVCQRPYPDPEDEIEDEMIQCVVCEDWLHGRHTGVDTIPEEYEEFLCAPCCTKHSFLYKYPQLLKETNSSKTEEDAKVDVEGVESTKENEEVEAVCCLEKVKMADNTDTQSAGGLFLPGNWRLKLCLCSTCKAMYEEQGIAFLTDVSDTVTEYEKCGKAKAEYNSYENGLQALNSIDRTQQVEVLTEYASMKDKLAEYLKKFAENKKVVREEDITEFFKDLKANKRQRTGLQQFCR